MNREGMIPPKVFISYSWSSQEHSDWVLNLATRLADNGIEVKLDKWDLKPGQDKYVFMEQMVHDTTINKVLMICDSRYKEKADNRDGGVGDETQIITPKLYCDKEQTKFIPVIAENIDNKDDLLPIYLKSRIYIDLSNEEIFEDEYKKLICHICDKPQDRRPALGKLPSYLFEDEVQHFKTSSIVKQLKNSITKNPNQAKMLIADFIDEFKSSLDNLKINSEQMIAPFDDVIFNKINDTLPLRNDFVSFFSTVIRSDINFDIDILIDFFCSINGYTYHQGDGTYYKIQFDHFKFLIHELFIYTVVILVENQAYGKLDILLSSPYFIVNNYKTKDPMLFYELRYYLESLEVRNTRLDSRRVTLHGDILVQRSVIEGKSYKNKIIDADLLLCYISIAKFESSRRYWFPIAYIFKGHEQNFEILNKLISKRHFEKVKSLFNVVSKEEIINKIDKLKIPDNGKGYSNCFERIPELSHYIDGKVICSMS